MLGKKERVILHHEFKNIIQTQIVQTTDRCYTKCVKRACFAKAVP